MGSESGSVLSQRWVWVPMLPMLKEPSTACVTLLGFGERKCVWVRVEGGKRLDVGKIKCHGLRL